MDVRDGNKEGRELERQLLDEMAHLSGKEDYCYLRTAVDIVHLSSIEIVTGNAI